MNPELVHVVFPLAADEHGWPPVSSERVWATPLGDDEYRIENAPWFVRGVAEGDVVRAVRFDDDDWPRFMEVARHGNSCTIRVIPRSDGPPRADLASTFQQFVPLGVTGEATSDYRIIALTITPDLDLAAIKALLAAGETDGRWDYEEGCVTDAWLDS